MHIILGGTGHVGAAAAKALLEQGEAVTVVTHDQSKADGLRAAGAEVAVVDVHGAEALRRVFRTGRRAFLLNPPADPAGDTDAEETRTAEAIVAALDGSGLEAVVAASTYGAQAGDRIGDLSTLWAFEQALKVQPIPAAINRGAYYFSNWDGLLASARDGFPRPIRPTWPSRWWHRPIWVRRRRGGSSSRWIAKRCAMSRGRNGIPRRT